MAVFGYLLRIYHHSVKSFVVTLILVILAPATCQLMIVPMQLSMLLWKIFVHHNACQRNRGKNYWLHSFKWLIIALWLIHRYMICHNCFYRIMMCSPCRSRSVVKYRRHHPCYQHRQPSAHQSASLTCPFCST